VVKNVLRTEVLDPDLDILLYGNKKKFLSILECSLISAFFLPLGYNGVVRYYTGSGLLHNPFSCYQIFRPIVITGYIFLGKTLQIKIL